MVKTKNRKQKQKYIYYIQKEAVEEVSFVSFWYKGVWQNGWKYIKKWPKSGLSKIGLKAKLKQD